MNSLFRLLLLGKRSLDFYLSLLRVCLSLNFICLNLLLHYFLNIFLFWALGHWYWALRIVLNRFNILIIFKFAFFYRSVFQSNFSKTMLHALLPISFVYWAINPKHLSIPMSFIILVSTNILISTFPFEFTIAMLLIIQVVTCVLIRVFINFIFQPFASTMLHSLLKLTNK